MDFIEEEPSVSDVEGGIGATEPNMTLESVRSRVRNLKLGEKVAILKYWDELKIERSGTKGKLVKWAQKTFHRQSFQKKDLNRLIDNAAKLREQYTTHSGPRLSYSNVCDREGKYPEMEERLAIRIRLLRKCGLIFETWMLAVEGMSILNRLYPLKFPREDGEDVDGTHSVFKFSRTWQQSFFKRHKFAYRRIGTRKNAAALKVDWIEKIEKYHLTVRALQLSEMNDPEYGFTKPEYVYTHDQVPIQLCASTATTIEDKGADEIYDCVGNEKDLKRFCSLNLAAPMKLLPDKSNLTRAHIVFQRDAGFQDGDDWHDAEERAQWDQRVIVSFQGNAWVDEETHIYALKKMFGPVNESLEGSVFKGVIFEDNLSSYKTDGVFLFIENELNNFIPPVFLPALMTFIIQVIDRHIGIIYKLMFTKH